MQGELYRGRLGHKELLALVRANWNTLRLGIESRFFKLGNNLLCFMLPKNQGRELTVFKGNEGLVHLANNPLSSSRPNHIFYCMIPCSSGCLARRLLSSTV